jgi:hypothetical protein
MTSLRGEGEPVKRYGIAFGGEVVGSHDTTKEAWEAYTEFEKLHRPIIDPCGKYTYSFHDGRKQVTIEEVRIKWRPR